jgi:hypothetical protein
VITGAQGLTHPQDNLLLSPAIAQHHVALVCFRGSLCGFDALCGEVCVRVHRQLELYVSNVLLALWRRGFCKTRLSFLSFPYVCPEPVLAKRSFLYETRRCSHLHPPPRAPTPAAAQHATTPPQQTARSGPDSRAHGGRLVVRLPHHIGEAPGALSRRRCLRQRPHFSAFPYICPKPVLAKGTFPNEKWKQTSVFRAPCVSVNAKQSRISASIIARVFASETDITNSTSSCAKTTSFLLSFPYSFCPEPVLAIEIAFPSRRCAGQKEPVSHLRNNIAVVLSRNHLLLERDEVSDH